MKATSQSKGGEILPPFSVSVSPHPDSDLQFFLSHFHFHFHSRAAYEIVTPTRLLLFTFSVLIPPRSHPTTHFLHHATSLDLLPCLPTDIATSSNPLYPLPGPPSSSNVPRAAHSNCAIKPTRFSHFIPSLRLQCRVLPLLAAHPRLPNTSHW